MTEFLDAAAAVVRHTAGFHHDRRPWQLCEEGGEAIPPDEGRLETSGRTLGGLLAVNEGRVVRPRRS